MEKQLFKKERLWYRQPAKVWEEALPLGNGHLGAMVFGGIASEHLQLNEESIWYGGPMHRENEDAARALPEIRSLIREGRIHEAERLMKYALTSTPNSMRPYQSLGDLKIDFQGEGFEGKQASLAEEYTRELDLSNALSRVSFVKNGIRYVRETFISRPDDCLIMHFTASQPGKIAFDTLLTRERYYNGVHKVYGEKVSSGAAGTEEAALADGVCLYGDLGKEGSDFALVLRGKVSGGSMRVIGERIVVEGADEAMLVLRGDSTFHGPDPEGRCMAVLERALGKTPRALFERHQTDYSELYDRVRLRLTSEDERKRLMAIPTDQRLEEVRKGKEDPDLMALYFQFGRYLLISCSRPGDLPANLQGIWNRHMLPPWDSKYTININTEMNYWPAEPASLPECHLPLFGQIRRMLPHGRETAEKIYGARGFVAHHNTDIWGDTSVQDVWNPGSYWPLGAAWLCTHQWTHYLYTQDRDFLEESFPVMREAAQFFLDVLIEDQGYLKLCPSVSPENTYRLPNGETGANGMGSTMDRMILHDLFSQCVKAAEILGVRDELNDRICDALHRLPPIRIGKWGQIMEWQEDYDEAEPGHRHISHLYGLYPSDQITVDGTPELARAAKQTLTRRLSFGGGHTGWSRAWIINFYARLCDGEEAYSHFRLLLERSTLSNLFDNHPPFQIDGNFGATAALAGMLVQAREDKLILLPALPGAFSEGRVQGLAVPGKAHLSLSWKEGKLTEAVLTAGKDGKFVVEYQGRITVISLAAGERKVLFS